MLTLGGADWVQDNVFSPPTRANPSNASADSRRKKPGTDTNGAKVECGGVIGKLELAYYAGR